MREILFAGAGGQGVLTSGLIMSEIASRKDFDATWSPQYGSAMRGGDANCTVKYGKEEIYNPMLEEPDLVLAMNQSTYDNFASYVKQNGYIVTNKDLVEAKPVREDIKVVQVPCLTMANELGRINLANIIVTGVIVKLLNDFSAEDAVEAMSAMFTEKGKGKYNDSNAEAFYAGYNSEYANET